MILTEETRSVLAAEASLPSLPRLVESAGGIEEMEEAAERWSESWDLPVEEGRDLRVRLSTETAEPLTRAIGHAGVSTAVRTVGETLAAASALKSEALTSGIAENLERAQVEHGEAVSALTAGRDAEALGSALEAADLLREVGPESVTRLLLARAESRLEDLEGGTAERTPGLVEKVAAVALGEASDGGPEPAAEQIDLERGRRLIRGARLALGQGDFVRAIQRAYYACQVLGLDPD